MNYILPDDRNQTVMFYCIDNMVEKTNAVRLIDLFIDKFISENPKDFLSDNRNNIGAPSYHPSTMLKLYFYGYLNRIKSSRGLEKESHRNIELIWLLGNLQPDHWTISNFRKSQGDLINKVWEHFKRFLKSNEYIDLKIVAIDGSKVKANAMREMLTQEKLKTMIEYSESKLTDYLKELEQQDKKESQQAESESESETESEILPDERVKTKKGLLEKIVKLESTLKSYKSHLENMETNELERLALNDPEVNLVLSRDGKIPGYNVQAVTDSKFHMIAEIEATTDENDMHQLIPMIDKVQETYNKKPEVAIMDSGYYNPDAIEEVTKSEVKIYVSPKKEKESGEVSFTYIAEKNIYVCSEGKELPLHCRNKKKRNSVADVYRCKDCKGCSKFGTCTESKYGRTISRYKNQDFRQSFDKNMRSKESKKMLKLRRNIVEHPFGTIKYLMGKIPLLLRGKKKISVEIKLYAMAYNFKRLINVSSFDKIMGEICAFSMKQ